jgi:hypothetical protein
MTSSDLTELARSVAPIWPDSACLDGEAKA